MKRLIPVLALLLLGSSLSSQESRLAIVLDLNGPIGPAASDYVHRGLEQAQEQEQEQDQEQERQKQQQQQYQYQLFCAEQSLSLVVVVLFNLLSPEEHKSRLSHRLCLALPHQAAAPA